LALRRRSKDLELPDEVLNAGEPDADKSVGEMMRVTILFGGLNKERLVSVASAQALSAALPDADLWFWNLGDSVHEAQAAKLQGHARPFEEPFEPGNRGFGGIGEALDRARAEDRVLVLALHGGSAEDGELQVMCEARGVAFTGSGSASSHVAFDKAVAKRFAALAGLNIAATVGLGEVEAGLREHGRLIAKPMRDGSSFGLIFVNSSQDLVGVRSAAENEDYLIEQFVSGVEATCGVLERADGSVIALPPIEIVPAEGVFDYTAKYLLTSTREICPGRFEPDVAAAIMDHAVRAHRAMSCRGYSRTDFVVSDRRPIYLETNTLPGLTKASLYPKALKAQGIEFVDFLHDQIVLAEKRAAQVGSVKL
jgi:D-alanine-D-alanine ligase